MAETSTSSTAGTHRDAVQKVREAQSFAVTLPVLGRVRLPRPEQLAFYGALGVLAAVEIIEWPVALVLATGHLLLQDEHSRVAQEIGEALEES
jgi:xanthosine utilization system XapX-like protein